MAAEMNSKYTAYREAFKGQRLPLAFVHLNVFDDNITQFTTKEGA